MAAGEFKIVEYLPGQVEGEVFKWSADKSTQGDVGARCAPVAPWDMPIQQRKPRTDYPGARIPSFQVLGPVRKPFTWSGTWDDRYNFKGFAVAEQKRFEKMVERGNPIRISFKTQVFWGMVDEFTPHYIRDSKIGYTFTFDPSSRDGEGDLNRSPESPEQPERALDDVDILAAATAQAHSQKPAWTSKGTLIGDTSNALGQVSRRMNDVAKALDTRQGVLKPIGDAKNLALQFRALQGDITGVVLKLAEARSDLNMGVRTAKSVLDFEAWIRNTSTLMRYALGRSKKAADAMDRRDIPRAKAIYKPFKGEHLYSISRKAYGTPFGTDAIMRANHLTAVVMTGTESLIIPEMGTV
jgi:hypothetical protein